MFRSLVFAVLALILVLPPSVAAQRPTPAAKTPSPAVTAPGVNPDEPVDLSSDPTRLFPDRVAAYIDIPHIGVVIDGFGVRDALLGRLNSALAPPTAPGEAADRKLEPALSSKDLSAMLDASASIGILTPGGDTLMFGGGLDSFAAVMRFGSRETADMFREKLLVPLSARGGGQSGTKRLHGLDVTTSTQVAYAASGRFVLFGKPEAVEAVLDTASNRRSLRIGDEPGFVSSSAKHTSGQDQILAYVPGRTLASFFGAMFGVRPDDGKARKPDPERDAMRSFVGLEALNGMMVGARVENGQLFARYDIEIERSIRGLVTTLADPPAISFRSAGLLPPTTEALSVFSVDATRIFDLLEQSYGSLPASGPSGSTFAGEVAGIEQYFGMSLRNDLLPAFGTEIGYTGSLDSVFGSRPLRKGEKRQISVFLLEVRNSDVVRKAISNLLSATAGKAAPPSDYKGAEIWSMGGTSVAISNGFALIGTTGDIKDCIDAQLSEATLARKPEFSATASGWHGDTLYATYRAASESGSDYHKFSEDLGTEVTPAVFLRAGLMTLSTPSTILRDGSGVHWENAAPTGPMLAGLNDLIKGLFVDAAAVRAGNDADDNEVLSVLHSMAIAESMFHNRANRYATLEELESDADLADSVDVASIGSRAAKAGYRFAVVPYGTGDGARFEITATPIEYAKPAKLSFYIDESFVVRAADKQGAPASVEDAVFGAAAEGGQAIQPVDESLDLDDEGSSDIDPGAEEAPE